MTRKRTQHQLDRRSDQLIHPYTHYYRDRTYNLEAPSAFAQLARRRSELDAAHARALRDQISYKSWRTGQLPILLTRVQLLRPS